MHTKIQPIKLYEGEFSHSPFPVGPFRSGCDGAMTSSQASVPLFYCSSAQFEYRWLKLPLCHSYSSVAGAGDGLSIFVDGILVGSNKNASR